MSGGNMGYVYARVIDAASMKHGQEFAELLHDTWWMSADTNKETYIEELVTFKGKWLNGDRAERLKDHIARRITRTWRC